jgi:hypothetical protein
MLAAVLLALVSRCALATAALAEPSPLPLAALVILGFLVGIAGHVYGSKTAIAGGIGLIMLGTVALPIAFYLTDR